MSIHQTTTNVTAKTGLSFIMWKIKLFYSSLNYASNINYSEAIIGLKNRALLLGGNAVSIVGWAENSQASGLTGNIYMCEGEKPYHIHPHP